MLNKINNKITLPPSSAHERLDQTLAKLMPEYSRTQIQEWIKEGAILVDEHLAKPKDKMRGGETISINAEIKPQIYDEPQEIPLNIVYEDDALIVINKPMDIVVHPGAGNPNGTILNALLHHAPELQHLPRAGILHRLDKNTSGLMVIAKTPAAFKQLSQQLKKRTLVREYQAIVYGTMISGGTVNAPIDRHPLKRKCMAVIETGREAITHYRVAKRFRAHTLLKVRLETGRTHQIRVHMSHIHHPIIGDVIYGGRVQLTKGLTPDLIQALRRFKRQALHAWALGLTHPVTKEFMRWESELPSDMQDLLEHLQTDTKSA